MATVPKGFTSAAWLAVGGLSSPSKMPGYAYSLPASKCITGSTLASVPGTVCHKCYALRGRYNFPNVQAAMARRFAAISDPNWADHMVLLIHEAATLGHTHFRWHDSGDIQSVDHLLRIFAICDRTHKVSHWLPTREQKIVSAASTVTPIPRNLVVRLSSALIDAPHTKFPIPNLTSSGVHTTTPTGYLCPASTQKNSCGSCRACWDTSIPHVSYAKH